MHGVETIAADWVVRSVRAHGKASLEHSSDGGFFTSLERLKIIFSYEKESAMETTYLRKSDSFPIIIVNAR